MHDLVEVADGVHVATSAVYLTTSTVVVAPGGVCLVVDPGVTAHEIDLLSSAIQGRGWRPIAAWSTHGHWDHLLDGGMFTGLPRWSAGWPVDVETLTNERDHDPELARALAAAPGDSPAPVGAAPPVPYPSVVDGQLDWPGPAIHVVAHDAHAPGSTSLVIPSADVLVAGDLLSDVEIPLLDMSSPDPVGTYRAALAQLAGTAHLVVPGHGHVGPLAPRVAADLAYLAGSSTDDPRLHAAWLVAAHESQRSALPA
ncbi:MBL fold metallo-hydrolase [Cellulomonas sp. URHE0023]|uniref:MBL fold metallo-hydrolase n=1 Tax=Cellulomonas sp. URHE0023 TaxID=1380354 RepID=UPI00068E10A8|nr:MBL fold metallo-hydrolase [Cellulomonas sp. URHE0023]